MSYPTKIYRFPKGYYLNEWVATSDNGFINVWGFGSDHTIDSIRKYKLTSPHDRFADTEWYQLAQDCLNGRYEEFLVWRTWRADSEKQKENTMNPSTFWIVWNPEGWSTPKHRYDFLYQAEAEAERLAKLNPGQEFYVCEIKSKFVAGEVTKTEFNLPVEDDVPF